jgi:hypothetical protein
MTEAMIFWQACFYAESLWATFLAPWYSVLWRAQIPTLFAVWIHRIKVAIVE